MTECSDLHRRDRNLLAEVRSAILRERAPSMDEVNCKFEISPRHCAQSVLMAACLSVTRYATACNIGDAGGQSGRPAAFRPEAAAPKQAWGIHGQHREERSKRCAIGSRDFV